MFSHDDTLAKTKLPAFVQQPALDAGAQAVSRSTNLHPATGGRPAQGTSTSRLASAVKPSAAHTEYDDEALVPASRPFIRRAPVQAHADTSFVWSSLDIFA